MSLFKQSTKKKYEKRKHKAQSYSKGIQQEFSSFFFFLCSKLVVACLCVHGWNENRAKKKKFVAAHENKKKKCINGKEEKPFSQ